MNDRFEELLSKLKELDNVQTQSDWAEDIPEDIWNEYFEDNFETVANNIDIDTHRWYEVSTTVLQIFDRFLGVRHISNMFSESSDYEDCYVKLEFDEMEAVQTTTYKIKKS